MTLATTARSMAGGQDSYAGVGMTYTITVGGTWAADDTFNINIANAFTLSNLNLGSGYATGIEPTFLLTYKNKENLLATTFWYFSAVGVPTVYNNLNALGNGFIDVSAAYSESDTVQAAVPYQGKVAVFGKNNVQIWVVDADPDNYQLTQVLENAGTLAKNSVKALGELDVFFLHQTGVRSLRVRDSSLNAMLVDVGSPIDSLIQSQLLLASATQKAAACGVIEPTTGQYWVFLYDTLYVLSYFPSAKISAWSTWTPTYQATNLSRVTNAGGTFEAIVKLGLVNDVTLATQTYTIPALFAQDNVLPAKYLWTCNLVTGAVITSNTIAGGLAFQGDINITRDGGITSQVANQLVFTPQKFVTYNGQVFVSTSEGFYVYGGAGRNTYDNAICAVETSWLDADSPANEKHLHGVDIAQSGSWNHYASTDYLSGNVMQILIAQTAASFDGGRVDISSVGTHLKYFLYTSGAAAKAIVSNLLFHYKLSKEK